MTIAHTEARFAIWVPRRTLLALGLGLAYALFVVLFPWDEISKGGFTDFEAYVSDFDFYASADLSKADMYQLTSLKDLLFSEFLWHELVKNMTRAIGDAATALRLLSFVTLFVWGAFLFRRVGFGIALLFLFNPMVIDVAMSAIRNGFAWALVLIGLSVRSRILRALLFVVGTLIHTSTLVLLVIYYGVRMMTRVLKGTRILALGAAGLGASIGLAVTFGRALLTEAIGDRRTSEDYIVGGGSLLQASLWAILLLLQCLSGRDYIRRNAFIIAVLGWYLAMNPFIPFSYRIWGAFLPPIAVAALELPPRFKQLFLYLYPGYLGLQYFYWTKFFEGWY